MWKIFLKAIKSTENHCEYCEKSIRLINPNPDEN